MYKYKYKNLQVNKEKPTDGGLHHSTYQAVVRRHGIFKTTSGVARVIDFNEDLAGPMSNFLSLSWNQIFK